MRPIDADELKKHAFRVSDCVFEDELNELVVSVNTIDNAQVVEEDCLHCKQYDAGYMYGFNIGYNKAKSEFKKPEGEWERGSLCGNTWLDAYYNSKCSECEHEYKDKSNFCPNCGAKMQIRR